LPASFHLIRSCGPALMALTAISRSSQSPFFVANGLLRTATSLAPSGRTDRAALSTATRHPRSRSGLSAREQAGYHRHSLPPDPSWSCCSARSCLPYVKWRARVRGRRNEEWLIIGFGVHHRIIDASRYISSWNAPSSFAYCSLVTIVRPRGKRDIWLRYARVLVGARDVPARRGHHRNRYFHKLGIPLPSSRRDRGDPHLPSTTSERDMQEVRERSTRWPRTA